MRIVRLSQTLPPVPGGLEVHARDLTLTQVDQGMQVDLIYSEGQAPCRPRVAAHRIDLTLIGWMHRWPAQQRFAWRAARYHGLGSGPVDAVHAHGDYAVAWAALHLARRFQCPSVLTVHGGLSDRPIHRALSGRVFPHLSHIIAVSEDVADQLGHRGVPRERLSIISSGIHTRRFASLNAKERSRVRSSIGIPAYSPLLLAVGRLHPVKGFQHLITAAQQLQSLLPDIRVVIVGDGPECASLRELASSSQVVSFTGAQPPHRIAELLASADLFALPSVCLGTQREGTPTSIMEAMAAGLPIIATSSGGIPQIVEDGVNGLIIPPGDPIALEKAVTFLLRDRELMAAMAVRNREAARDRDWDTIARRVAEVYTAAASTWTKESHTTQERLPWIRV